MWFWLKLFFRCSTLRQDVGEVRQCDLCANALQQSMQKRLHYAMPRVPLVKLKPDINKGNINNQPQSHVGTIAKIIGNTKRSKRQAEEDHTKENDVEIEISEENVAPEMDTGSQKHVDNFRLEQVTESFDNLRQVLGEDLNRREWMQMRKLEKRIRNVIKQRTTEDSLGEETSESLNSDYSCDTDVSNSQEFSDVDSPDLLMGELSNEFCAGNRLNVVVDVHQELNEDKLDGAVGEVLGKKQEKEEETEKTSLFKFKGHSGYETFPKRAKNHKATSHMVKTWLERNKRENEMESRRQIEGKFSGDIVEYHGDMQCSLEESSDSDSEGGWDFETGGMPLLPR